MRLSPAALLSALVVALICVACGSSSTTKPASTGSPSVAASPTTAPGVATAEARATAIGPALYAEGDLPTDLQALPGRTTMLHQTDVPGLTGPASSYSIMVAASEDPDEFVTVAAVLPADGNAGPLLDAMTADVYGDKLTGGASDGTATAITIPGAPAGARALSYSATLQGSDAPHQIEGEALGFVHGDVFVLLMHGRYAASTRAIDLGALATRIDGRLG